MLFKPGSFEPGNFIKQETMRRILNFQANNRTKDQMQPITAYYVLINNKPYDIVFHPECIRHMAIRHAQDSNGHLSLAEICQVIAEGEACEDENRIILFLKCNRDYWYLCCKIDERNERLIPMMGMLSIKFEPLNNLKIGQRRIHD